MSRSTSGDEAPGGLVSLVGAGPGDPKLITLLGLERLKDCQVVVYDRLIPHALLDEVPQGAERIDVGKDPGQPKIPQREINRILVEKASQGLRVVRLKGGDPLVFARIGEEIAALREAGIPFEIVPGVTAASAAAAEAAVPLTHRGVSSSVTIVTGHEDPDKEVSQIPWGPLVGVGTLVFYMVGGRVGPIAERLLSEGLAGKTPAVIVSEATLPNRKVTRSTLGELTHMGEADLAGHPAVLIVGETVALAPE